MHPLALLDGEDLALVDIWRAWRGSGLGGGMGAGPLPFAGGIADQPACTMRALDIMEAAYRKLRPPRQNGSGE